MACERIPSGGSAIIICSRGRRSRSPCGVPGCGKPHTRLCDHPVTRKGRAGTCDAKLCDGHAHHYEPDTDLCAPHAKAREMARVEGNRQGKLPL